LLVKAKVPGQLNSRRAISENSPLADLANSLGFLIGNYEDAHHEGPELSPVATLRFLMEQHRLTQSDLPEFT